MNINSDMAIDVEFYEPCEVRLNDVCTITLFRRVLTETFYESENDIERFKQDEDLFLSWLASMAYSKGYQLAKAMLRTNGFTLEVLYTNVRSKYNINFPYLSRIRRVYLTHGLKHQKSATDLDKGADIATGSASLVLLQDFSGDELYVFNSPITVMNSSKSDALVIEADGGIALVRFDELDQGAGTTVESKKEKKRKSNKKSGRRSRKAKRRRRAKTHRVKR